MRPLVMTLQNGASERREVEGVGVFIRPLGLSAVDEAAFWSSLEVVADGMALPFDTAGPHYVQRPFRALELKSAVQTARVRLVVLESFTEWIDPTPTGGPVLLAKWDGPQTRAGGAAFVWEFSGGIIDVSRFRYVRASARGSQVNQNGTGISHTFQVGLYDSTGTQVANVAAGVGATQIVWEFGTTGTAFANHVLYGTRPSKLRVYASVDGAQAQYTFSGRVEVWGHP